MDNLSLRGGVGCTSSGLLTNANASETVYDTTVAIWYHIGGKAYVKATVADGTTPTTDVNTGVAFPALVGGASVANTPGHGCVVVWGLNAAGTVQCAMGPHESLDMQGNFINAPKFAPLPADFCPFAYGVYKAGATASATAIVFGTANWNATGFTNAIQNVFYLPTRPQVA